MVERVSFTLALGTLKDIAEELADKMDEARQLRERRDDLIRDAIQNGVPKTRIGRATDLSVEQIRNIEFYRYTRESRRVAKKGAERA